MGIALCRGSRQRLARIHSEGIRFLGEKLAKYNEVPKDYPLEAGDIVYLEKKKKKAEKGYDYCIVRSGDSMHTIAQRYGIRLKNLYKMNKLPDDYTPSVGDTLRLR